MPAWFRSQIDQNSAIPASAGGQDDAALIAAAKADPAAFGALYELYIDPIYRYCFVRLGSREAAEDATSEVFLKALAGLESYRGGVFIAWLFRIANNVIIDTYRRGKRSLPIDEAGDMQDSAPTPEDLAVSRSESTALRAALQALSQEHRAVLELKLVGLSGDQIAAAMGKSPAAVKMLRYRAVARLRDLLYHDHSRKSEANEAQHEPT